MTSAMHATARWLTSVPWCFLLLIYAGIDRAAGADSSTFPEVNLVFPLNETYAPSPIFPVAFAFQNFDLGDLMYPRLDYNLREYKNGSRGAGASLELSDHKSKLSFESRGFTALNVESTWILEWQLQWAGCNTSNVELSSSLDIRYNYSVNSLIFTTSRESTRQPDLLAEINNQDTCSKASGVTFNITDSVKKPVQKDYDMEPGDKCGVLSFPTPPPNPCQVKLKEKVASSMSSSMTASVCNVAKHQKSEAPVSCPAEGAAQGLVAWPAVYLAAAAFGLDFILVGA